MKRQNRRRRGIVRIRNSKERKSLGERLLWEVCRTSLGAACEEQDAGFSVKKAKEVSSPDKEKHWTANEGGTAEEKTSVPGDGDRNVFF